MPSQKTSSHHSPRNSFINIVFAGRDKNWKVVRIFSEGSFLKNFVFLMRTRRYPWGYISIKIVTTVSLGGRVESFTLWQGSAVWKLFCRNSLFVSKFFECLFATSKWSSTGIEFVVRNTEIHLGYVSGWPVNIFYILLSFFSCTRMEM